VATAAAELVVRILNHCVHVEVEDMDQVVVLGASTHVNFMCHHASLPVAHVFDILFEQFEC